MKSNVEMLLTVKDKREKVHTMKYTLKNNLGV